MNSAGVLVRKLTRARDIARDLDFDTNRDLARSHTPSEASDTFANLFSLPHALDRALDLATAVCLSRGDQFYDRARCLGSNLFMIRCAAIILHGQLQDLRGGSEGDRDRARIKAISHILERSSGIVADLIRFVEIRRGRSVNRDPESGAKTPSVLSSRLTWWAARLLPPADRPEYAELFWSELYDLAQSRSSRCAQISHALRVLMRAPVLRRELRVPARERSW